MAARGIRCCLCGCWQSQVPLMIVASDGAICSRCVAICAEEISIATAGGEVPPAPVEPPAESDAVRIYRVLAGVMPLALGRAELDQWALANRAAVELLRAERPDLLAVLKRQADAMRRRFAAEGRP